jgi:hypothetical protein
MKTFTKFINHPICAITGGALLIVILISTFLRVWGFDIPAKFVFSYAALIILPIVSVIYWIKNK